MSVILYHNPRCSKSRATLALLQERGIEPHIVEYLKNPPNQADILKLIEQLGGDAAVLVRQSEAEFKESGLSRDASDPNAIAIAIARFPKLLQRPIVVNGARACIGRPPEAVTDIL